jgi:hypothetical protein
VTTANRIIIVSEIVYMNIPLSRSHSLEDSASQECKHIKNQRLLLQRSMYIKRCFVPIAIGTIAIGTRYRAVVIRRITLRHTLLYTFPQAWFAYYSNQ